MSISGIDLDPEIVELYEDERMGDGAQLVLKIEDEQIRVENEGNTFDEMVASLPEDEPRYILFDIPIKNRADIETHSTVFIVWMPMKSGVRKRMLYSSTKSVITSNLRAISTTVQEGEKERLTLDRMQEKVNQNQGINTR